MKKIILFISITLSALVVNAQTAFEDMKLLDNIYAGGFIGGMGPLDTDDYFPVNPSVGVKVGKDFSPYFGINVEGVAWFNDHAWEKKSNNFVKSVNIGLNADFNLTNMIAGYRMNRTFTVQAEVGLGWLIFMNSPVYNGYDGHTNGELSCKTGLILGWRVGKAWQIYAEPLVRWNLSNDVADGTQLHEIRFHKDYAQMGLEVGCVYYFKNSNGTHKFKSYDIAELNNQINHWKSMYENKAVENIVTANVIVKNDTITSLIASFDYDSSELTEEDKLVLNQLPSGSKVIIKGYATEEGSDGYNIKLAQRRADAVSAYLEKRNIETLKTFSYGENGNILQRIAFVKVIF